MIRSVRGDGDFAQMKILLGSDLICEEDCTCEWTCEEDRTCEEGFDGIGYVRIEG